MNLNFDAPDPVEDVNPADFFKIQNRIALSKDDFETL
jgi:hypothetical protein